MISDAMIEIGDASLDELHLISEIHRDEYLQQNLLHAVQTASGNHDADGNRRNEAIRYPPPVADARDVNVT